MRRADAARRRRRRAHIHSRLLNADKGRSSLDDAEARRARSAPHAHANTRRASEIFARMPTRGALTHAPRLARTCLIPLFHWLQVFGAVGELLSDFRATQPRSSSAAAAQGSNTSCFAGAAAVSVM
jgi:hypothetical protein